jgi:hypothetical protein
MDLLCGWRDNAVWGRVWDGSVPLQVKISNLNSNSVLDRVPYGGRPIRDKPHGRPASSDTFRDFHRAQRLDKRDV